MGKKIEGDFFNVMGLPLNAIAESLKKFGVKILGQWNNLS
jgi:predicted house-cleaning NTP pyrophosphatase (Maf/HAM1 superfamily)